MYVGKLKNYVDICEKDLKKHVKSANGKVDASLPFLNDTSRDAIVRPRHNGKQRKCLQIPHTSLSEDVIKKLIARGRHFYVHT